MPYKNLPASPDLEHLKRQAKSLMKAHGAHDPAANQRLREFLPRFRKSTDPEISASVLSLADAQFAIAREYGFASWTKLKTKIAGPEKLDQSLPHQDRIEDPTFRQAVDLMDAGDAVGLQAHLRSHPELVRQRVFFNIGSYFGEPTLLEFAAENPIRRGALPPNIAEMAKVILEAGAKADGAAVDRTLGLISSGKIPRECNVQIPLIDLMCDYGANPNEAMAPALGHGEFAAVEALIRRGARIDLPASAASGRIDEARKLLTLASPEDRHRALAYATQHGWLAIVRMLLDAGEDPNRFNPIGCHSHSTPLHQAALAGHLAIVELLVERGANHTTKDIMFGGTPLGWAEHGGQTAVVEYLRCLN